MSRILIADDDAAITEVLATTLQEAGHECLTAADGRTALELALTTRPDLIVLDILMPELSGDEVHRRLRRDPSTCYLPVIFVTARDEPREGAKRLRAGADDYVSKPFDTDELVARVDATLRRAAQLRSLNPLSGLPGNLTIAAEIEGRLRGSRATSCLYVDVDRFKPFNDRYGFAKGDRLIAELAELLLSTASGKGTFVGHVGGDDFVVLAPTERAEQLASEITTRFDELIGGLYDPQDRERGYIEDTDRQGRARRVPFATVSIGIVPLAADRFANATDVARAAAEMKEVAKREKGSAWAVDRRRSGATAASPTP